MMKYPPINSVLAFLEQTPAFVRSITENLDEEKLRWKPGPDRFSLLEQACHLRDLEVEGYTVRINRLLKDNKPVLAGIDGARLAREREYNSQNFGSALSDFAEARKRNMSTLEDLPSEQWQRTGVLAGEIVSLKGILEMMWDHDKSHRSECEELLKVIVDGA